MSVRGQYAHTTGTQTEPSHSNSKKRPAFESVTAGSLSAAKSPQQGPEAKRLKLESTSEEAAEREVLRLRGGARGHHRKSTANRSSPAAGAPPNKDRQAASAPEASGTSQPPSTQASSSQTGRAGTLPETMSTSKPSSSLKTSFHPAKPASASTAPSSAIAPSSGSNLSSSSTIAQPLPMTGLSASTSAKKSVWGSSTSAAVKSAAGSANSAMVREGERKIPAAHPKAVEAKRENINTDLGIRLEGPDQHIARPSVDFSKESSSYRAHVKDHPELLEPGFQEEAIKLAKSDCSKDSPAWRYPNDVKSDNKRENRLKEDALKVGRHSQNGRPMAVIVTGPSTIKTAFYLTYTDQNKNVVDYNDPLTYFNKNAKI